MNERAIVLEALRIQDPDARQTHVHAVCGGDAGLLARVLQLLAVHESNVESPSDPTGKVHSGGSPDPGETQTLGAEQVDVPGKSFLGFFGPSARQDVLGRLAHYEILEVLGHGAFGTVFRAFDDKLQRVVAIKILAPELAATSPPRKRFLREARASAAIRHENVVGIHAVEDEPIPYLVMEYIPGRTLGQRLADQGPLDVPEVLRLGKQIAYGLAAAHAEQLIHRDVKPGNILLDASLGDRVKITDFGLARAADDAGVTQSGVIAGTPSYMSPEQAGGRTLDARSDLFSLGSVLYQMLTGRPPFRAPNTMAVLKRVTEDEPRPIRDLVPEVPAWLCAIVARLHAKDPQDRFASAREVGDLLELCLRELQEGRIPNLAVAQGQGTRNGSSTPAGKRKRPVLMIGIVLLLLASGLGILETTGVTRWTTLFRGNSPGDAPKGPHAAIGLPPPAQAPFDAPRARAHQEAWAAHLGEAIEKDFDLGEGVKLTMVLVPPGEFMMGSPRQERDFFLERAREFQDEGAQERIPSEGPQHRVRITRPFRMGRFEVTHEQFRLFVAATGYVTEPERDGHGGFGVVEGAWVLDPKYVWNGPHEYSKGKNVPVVLVTWNDAEAFCRWLTGRQEGIEFSLPTEAQWEYACRAGSTSRWHGGDREADLEQSGWYVRNSGAKLHAVGGLLPNAFGLYDMHGNVWEWCADWYAGNWYAASPTDDPTGPATGTSRLQRGGDWYYGESSCRSAARHHGEPGNRSVSLGFRVAATVRTAGKATE